MTAKSTPYLSCHRDNLPAKVPGPVTGWLRQVTQPPFIAGPLGSHYERPQTDRHLYKLILTIQSSAIFIVIKLAHNRLAFAPML